MGIRGASFIPSTRRISKLSPLLPGTIAGPDLPPRSAALSESSRSWPMAMPPEWHFAHDCWKMGRISRSKLGDAAETRTEEADKATANDAAYRAIENLTIKASSFVAWGDSLIRISFLAAVNKL